MGLSTRHPLYEAFAEDWQVMRDCHRGERAVKAAGTQYLPATSGMVLDGMEVGQRGRAAYNAYRLRARFPDFVQQAVQAMLGFMHHKPPTIQLPSRLEPMRERATVQGESLEMLLRRVNEEQLTTGRLGLLLDVPTRAPAATLPYVAMYRAEDVINWDTGQREELVEQRLNLVVLDESADVRTNQFEWTRETQFRVLVLGDPEKNVSEGAYRMGVYAGDQAMFDEARLIQPSIAGRTLDRIPFVFINARDLVPDPEPPPLLGLAQIALGMYRGEADYRQSLFLQGQDTLVVIGSRSGEDVRAGAGAMIEVDHGGDAKFIGVNSDGLAEQRQALENDRSAAAEMGGKLLDNRGGNVESGDALRIRVSARTATLTQIVMSGAEGVQDLLRMAAVWVGADPNEVVITPNLDFVDEEFKGSTLVEYMNARSMGAPISLRSIHDMLREKNLTRLSFEEEMAQIEAEGGVGAELPSGGEGVD